MQARRVVCSYHVSSIHDPRHSANGAYQWSEVLLCSKGKLPVGQTKCSELPGQLRCKQGERVLCEPSGRRVAEHLQCLELSDRPDEDAPFRFARRAQRKLQPPEGARLRRQKGSDSRVRELAPLVLDIIAFIAPELERMQPGQSVRVSGDRVPLPLALVADIERLELRRGGEECLKPRQTRDTRVDLQVRECAEHVWRHRHAPEENFGHCEPAERARVSSHQGGDLR